MTWRLLKIPAIAAVLAFSSQALAHNPMCECKAIEDGQIRCTGGFSDGSGAPGVTLDVIGYDSTNTYVNRVLRYYEKYEEIYAS